MSSAKRQRRLSSLYVNLTLLFVVLLWTIPTLGIFVSSFRVRNDIATSGWWSILPHREWQATEVINPRDEGLDPDGVMEIRGLPARLRNFGKGLRVRMALVSPGLAINGLVRLRFKSRFGPSVGIFRWTITGRYWAVRVLNLPGQMAR
jgi:ABC-type glycerol-3-phosphate transport system permease component